MSLFRSLHSLKPLLNPAVDLSPFLRCFSTDHEPEPAAEPEPGPSHQPHNDPIVTQALDLLQAPENSWDPAELNRLLFSNSPTTVPTHFSKITLGLGASGKALKFLDFVQSHSPQKDAPAFLSHTFQSIVKLASREPGWEKALLELYKMSKQRDIPLTINALTLLVSFFGRAGMVDEAVSVFDDIDRNARDRHLYELFVGMLFRYGRFESALKVLDEMLELHSRFAASDIPRKIFFSALLRRLQGDGGGHEDEIDGIFVKLLELGVFPDSIALLNIIKKLCRNGEIGRAWDLLLRVIQSGGPVEAAPCNVILVELGKRLEFNRMRELMIKMKEISIQPDVVTLGILINSLCKSRRVDDALEVFERICTMHDDGFSWEPDAVIYNCLIDGLCKVGRLDEAAELLRKMTLQDGCMPNVITYNCLIDGYCKCCEIDKAFQLFDQMSEEGVQPNVVTVNTLVDGMCKFGRVNSAVEFLKEMKVRGLSPNVRTYTSLIKAFCNANNFEKAMELFQEISRSGCSPDSIAYYTLISGLCTAGRMDDASSVATELKAAGFSLDAVCYNNLIGGFCRKNKLEEAYEMVKEMESSGVKPDAVTYNCWLSYNAKTGNLTTANKLMRLMIEQGLVPTVVSYGALIHGYCLENNVEEAMKIFREMNSVSKIPPNTVIYNILIECLCRNDEVDSACSLMDDMMEKGVRPNTTTFNALFRGLRQTNCLKKAFEVMDRMHEHACKPDYVTMEILMEWLSAVGEVGKLKSFVQGYEVAAFTA
ncbi:pentatricopeptide repeat-containing protein At5g28460-like [Rhodamnia argentea]|uniref:Pentatricopeptide repeat-containing protein At5g28460-like n=1 Tax=Rhodamnia argentea TaxID=178133 RepID=A0A8B8QNF6_9MYRT|nr:pentatricopeptide repeat-containing protein At5g28460-like [Rhodamnia argentea]